MLNVLSIVTDVLDYLKNHPKYIIAGCVLAVILVILVVVLIIKSNKDKKDKTIDKDEKLIKETLKEDALALKQEEAARKKAERKAAKAQQKGATEEPVVEEEPAAEAIQPEEEAVVEEPAVEEVVEETPAEESEVDEIAEEPVEEAVEEETKAEEPVVEEQPEEVVVEEPVREETEKKAPAKRGRKPKTQESASEPVAETPAQEETPVVKPETPEKKQRVITGKYEVYYDGTGYFYILKASNGEPLITSEVYASKDSVMNAIAAIKRNVEVGTITISSDKRGLFQFSLTAKNHRTLVMSANYSTEKRAISASESFKRFAAISPIVEIEEQVESVKELIEITAPDKNGGKIGVVQTEDGYIYMLKASNGEILVQSEPYKTQASAENGLKTLKDAIKNGKFYVIKDKRGYYQYKLFSSTNRIVAAGETYPSKQQAISAANSMVSFVNLAAPIVQD